MELLIELGFPELPATVIAGAEREFGEILAAAIVGAGLADGDLGLRTFSTPRRLAVWAGPLRARAEDRRISVRGPAWGQAFAADGQPTGAAWGFARSQGAQVESLRREATPQGDYAFLDREIPGRPAREVLLEILAQGAAGIHFPRTMRWAEGAPRFPRPLGWMLALLDAETLPVAIGPVAAQGVTHGHRVLAPGPWPVGLPAQYAAVLHQGHVIADRGERREAIAEAIDRVTEGRGITAEVSSDLLDEVTDLSEWPEAFLGDFDPAFLEVPGAVLRATMIHHQRFFPVRRTDGGLAPHFVAVRNGGAPEIVRRGNETVLAARLADALFFFREDRQRTLASRRDELQGITYAPGLGSLLARSERLARLGAQIAAMAGREEIGRLVSRAGEIALCDRATAVVRELPELEGTMGGEYARLDGEDEAVAAAIAGRVRPRGPEDELPPDPAGQILALADRLDHVLGFIAVGRTPTGSQDPFGLRRAAIAALRLLEALPRVRLQEALDAAAQGYRELLGEQAGQAIEGARAFLGARLQARAEEQGYDARIVQAVLRADLEPAHAAARIAALAQAHRTPSFAALVQAARRARNLAQPGAVVGAEGAEGELLHAVEALEREGEELLARADYVGYLGRAAELWGPLDHFFSAVLVMDPDQGIQARRRAILHRAHRALSRIAEIADLDVSE